MIYHLPTPMPPPSSVVAVRAWGMFNPFLIVILRRYNHQNVTQILLVCHFKKVRSALFGKDRMKPQMNRLFGQSTTFLIIGMLGKKELV